MSETKPSPRASAAIIATIDEWEKRTYTDRAGDLGGPTKYGITWKTLRDWRESTGEAPTRRPLSPAGEVADMARWAAQVQDLELDEAVAIYDANYWRACKCDYLLPGVDRFVFDTAVNQGPGRAGRVLQEALNRVLGTSLTLDGAIGPKTLGSAVQISGMRGPQGANLIAEMAAIRLRYYMGLGDHQLDVNGYGWSRRVCLVTVACVREYEGW